MDDRTLLILAGGSFAAWYFFFRVPLSVANAPVPPAYNPYTGVAGYYPQPNTPTNPGDPNSWAPQLTTSLVGLTGSILNAVTKGSGPATSSGSYSGTDPYASFGNDPYASSVGDGGWSNDGLPADW